MWQAGLKLQDSGYITYQEGDVALLPQLHGNSLLPAASQVSKDFAFSCVC